MTSILNSQCFVPSAYLSRPCDGYRPVKTIQYLTNLFNCILIQFAEAIVDPFIALVWFFFSSLWIIFGIVVERNALVRWATAILESFNVHLQSCTSSILIYLQVNGLLVNPHLSGLCQWWHVCISIRFLVVAGLRNPHGEEVVQPILFRDIFLRLLFDFECSHWAPYAATVHHIQVHEFHLLFFLTSPIHRGHKHFCPCGERHTLRAIIAYLLHWPLIFIGKESPTCFTRRTRSLL